jgi:hypothetical protein
MKMYEGVMQLVDELEQKIKGYRNQEWHPEYAPGLLSDRLDVDMVFTGEILVESNPDTEDAATASIGEIEDEEDAELICDAINALPHLIGYIRHLQQIAVRPGATRKDEG